MGADENLPSQASIKAFFREQTNRERFFRDLSVEGFEPRFILDKENTWQDFIKRIYKLIKSGLLTPDQREVFELRLRGLSFGEISRKLNISKTAVYKRWELGLKKLKTDKKLQKYFKSYE